MTVVQMRELVKGAYSGIKWINKVNDMSDGQVTAIFNRLRAQGKIKV